MSLSLWLKEHAFTKLQGFILPVQSSKNSVNFSQFKGILFKMSNMLATTPTLVITVLTGH